MKKLLTLFALLALVPAFAFAQGAPPPGPGGPPWRHPDLGAMRQNMQQMETLHKQFRAKVLGLLTPAHRNLLASVAGELAVSSSPDPKAAVQKLDAALTSSEKQAILNAAQSFMTQQRALFEQAFTKMRAANPDMPSPRPRASGMDRARHTPDAGELLLMIATGGGEGPGMGMHGGFMHARPWPSPTP